MDTSNQLTPEAFKQRIVQKYPNGVSSDGQKYSDMDATQLTQRIAQKYPQGMTNDGHKYSDFLPQTASTTGTTAPSETPSEPSLAQNLIGRVNDVGAAGNTAVQGLQDISSGNFLSGAGHLASGVLQGAGAAAGAVGDVTNKAIELIPGVKWIENAIGTGVGKLAETPEGKAVVQSVQSWTSAHPELTKDMEAGFNILTAIPIFKGLSAVKDITLSGLGKTLESAGKNAVTTDLGKVIATSKAGRVLLDRSPNILKDIVDGGAIQDFDVVDGKLSTSFAHENTWNKINDLNGKVQEFLDNKSNFRSFDANSTGVGGVQKVVNGKSIAQKALEGYSDRFDKSIPGIKNTGLSAQELIDNAKELDGMNRVLWDKFSRGEATVKEVNQLRTALDSKVKTVFTDGSNPKIVDSKRIGAQLSGAMRNYVQTTVKETQPFFEKMNKLFDIQDALKPGGIIDGKKIPVGILRKTAQRAASSTAGGLVGHLVGGGTGEILGGLTGLGASNALNPEALGGIRGSLAARGGIFKNLTKGIVGKTAKAATASESQKLFRQ